MSAARSVLRSAVARTPAAMARLSGRPNTVPRPASSPFRNSQPNLLSHRIFRTPVAMSCCVETMLPYHSATASALLNSMLPVCRTYGWTSEDCNDDV